MGFFSVDYIGSGSSTDTFYRRHSVEDLIQSSGGRYSFDYYTRTTETRRDGYGDYYVYDRIGQYHNYDHLYTDPDTGIQYSDKTQAIDYDILSEVSHLEAEKIVEFSQMLQTQYGVSEDKAERLASLSYQLQSLDFDSMNESKINELSNYALGVTPKEVLSASSPGKIFEVAQKVGAHLGTSTTQTFNLTSLLLFP